MMRGLFVTGTDTGVGKTVVCAALWHRFHADAHLRYWKPVQTGIEQDDDSAEVIRLVGAPAPLVLDAGARLPRPLSPHLSARLAGVSISVESLVEVVGAQAAADRWIVEGAGGVLVPLNDRALMVDLMVRLALPVVVVARSALGTINHTLLTLEALRVRRLTVAGVVMVGAPDRDNREAVEQFGRVPVVGELPPLQPLCAGTLRDASAALDRESVLQPYLSGRGEDT